MTLAERFKHARKLRGLSQIELANAVGCAQSLITKIENGETERSKFLVDFARELDVRPEWLSEGAGTMEYGQPMFSRNLREDGADEYADAGDGSFTFVQPFNANARPRDLVPLISWVQAGQWCEADDPFAAGEAEDWLPCPVKHSPSTFVLRVRGDSMTAPYGRSYPDGIYIFVDPEQRGGVEPGERVIAKINGENGVTFKQLASDNGKMFLKPLNPQYPSIFEPFRILGKVIFAGWEE